MRNPSQRPPASPPPGGPPRPVGLADLAEARALYAQLDPAWFDEATDPQAWLLEPEVQKLIAEVVDAEVAPFAALLSPDELRALREEIELACHTDPTTIDYLDRLRPRRGQDGSGKVPKGTFQAAAKVVALPGKKAGGQRP